jgi:hypothetical protein
MRNRHRDIHIHPLAVELKAISYEPERQLYIWGSRVRLLQIAHNWVLACFNYNRNYEKEQCKYSNNLIDGNPMSNPMEILI